MADPHIKSPMDIWDTLTVIIYRSGFVLAGIMILLLPYQPQIAYLGILVSAIFCASSLHIYLKHFRLLLQFASWIALLCHILDLPALALGGALVTLRGLAFKEYFCFKVPLLNLQPIFVAILWLCVQLDSALAIQIFSLIVGILFIVLAFQKWRMPLYFDIGDKTKYQV
ncbi:DUF2301 domain-containing membrane protein [Pasteurella skyensis]|uniref:DUF2301 domain-containing membrane protein n=1 Tax=Phocoenobacter skyensis TaxID=97481 RepID=A0AAJ6P0J7_9PAST|nr:DUF2301 domain-containing membrane protein [Pasteurella skyensis]MDP8162275.1 DUF2301 domain-containing membrane protein [Pasteurella skyensis]MDP8172739.1 DUF2301 domain-containing membrane protein [Pasteurella skyensis]MDP8176901.1 DUF2301 domain-containing membrane protein [Pasteurella skyensis]MDP8179239.1 DUF2301 domain-containing membrane protein [Pasteurella skyensis]MDP8183306.1 DUF2301 domain-containing membrane protein [Pasteurella skyensis]